jgi:hypothetical protein
LAWLTTSAGTYFDAIAIASASVNFQADKSLATMESGDIGVEVVATAVLKVVSVVVSAGFCFSVRASPQPEQISIIVIKMHDTNAANLVFNIFLPSNYLQ